MCLFCAISYLLVYVNIVAHMELSCICYKLLRVSWLKLAARNSQHFKEMLILFHDFMNSVDCFYSSNKNNSIKYKELIGKCYFFRTLSASVFATLARSEHHIYIYIYCGVVTMVGCGCYYRVAYIWTCFYWRHVLSV